MTEEKKTAIVAAANKLLAESLFTAVRVYTHHTPHPYTIGPRHVVHAADHFSGLLSENAIRSYEKQGGHCADKGCRLSYAEHKSEDILMLNLSRDLSNYEAAQALFPLKKLAEDEGIAGFGFLNLGTYHIAE
jgi:hypothetical protein